MRSPPLSPTPLLLLIGAALAAAALREMFLEMGACDVAVGGTSLASAGVLAGVWAFTFLRR